MSDEQTMPEVIYANDEGEWREKGSWDMASPYLRCPEGIDPDDAMVVSKKQNDARDADYADLLIKVDTNTMRN